MPKPKAFAQLRSCGGSCPVAPQGTRIAWLARKAGHSQASHLFMNLFMNMRSLMLPLERGEQSSAGPAAPTQASCGSTNTGN